MEKELEDIDNAVVKHYRNSLRYDEHIFNLGVRLGRLLEKHGLDSYRLKSFIENENQNNLIHAKVEQIRRIEGCIEFLIRNAVAQHIEEGDSFLFGDRTSSELDSHIVQKFFVQSASTIHSDESSFQVEFKLYGEVADIFEKYGVDRVVNASISNTTGDIEETLYKAEDVKEIFSASVPINSHHTKLTERQIADMADELEKIIVVLTLSLTTVR